LPVSFKKNLALIGFGRLLLTPVAPPPVPVPGTKPFPFFPPFPLLPLPPPSPSSSGPTLIVLLL